MELARFNPGLPAGLPVFDKLPNFAAVFKRPFSDTVQFQGRREDLFELSQALEECLTGLFGVNHLGELDGFNGLGIGSVKNNRNAEQIVLDESDSKANTGLVIIWDKADKAAIIAKLDALKAFSRETGRPVMIRLT